MLAWRQLCCIAVHFLWPILTQRSGKLCIRVFLSRVSLILLIMHVNEVTDVCCMCHIFACLSSVGIVNMCHTFTYLLSVMWLLSIFHTRGVLPSSRLSLCVRGPNTCSFIDLCANFERSSIHVGDLNSCLFIPLCAAFERAFDVSRFGVGVINLIC
jgi:hypothetical protein